MTKKKLPREVRWKINSLAFRSVKHFYPHHRAAYERYKEIIQGHYEHLTAEGVPEDQVLSLLEDPHHKLMDKLDEVMKKLQNTH